MHSQLPRFLHSIASQPLAIERRTFDAFRALIRRRGLEGLSFDGAAIHAGLEVAQPRATRQAGSDRNIQVIPIGGTIMNRAHSAGDGTIPIGRRIDQAVADARVDAIVLDVDSPGGTVTGVPELAAKIREAKEEKPVIAHANGTMASAAYWIASGATEVVMSPSSEVGSIGVFTVHEDWSKWLEEEGVVVTEIAAGKFKTEGAPWKPLDAEAGEFLASQVAAYYDWFIRDVAAGRGDTPANVRAGYGEGRVLGAKDAKAAGLVDRIETLDQTIARLSTGRLPGRKARADAAMVQEAGARKRARERQA